MQVRQRAGELVLRQRRDQFRLRLFQRLAGRLFDRFDLGDDPAERPAHRADHAPARRGKGGVGDRGAVRAGISGLGDGGLRRGFQAGGAGGVGQRRAALHLGGDGVGAGLIGDHDLRDRALFGGGEARRLALVGGGDFGVGRRGGGLHHLGRDAGVADDAPFRHGEARDVAAIESLQFGVGGRRAAGERGGGDERDLAGPLFEHQRGIGQRDLLRHLRRPLRRQHQLLRDDVACDVGADLRVGQLLVGEQLLVADGIELAVGTAQAGDAGDDAVDRTLADDHALVLAEAFQRDAVDRAVQRGLQAALFEQLFHGQRRDALAGAGELGLDALAQLGGRDLRAADGGDAAARQAGAVARETGDVARGEGQRDDAQHDEGDDDAGLGIDDPAEEAEHGVADRP